MGQGGVLVTEDSTVLRRAREVKDQGRATRGTGGADDHPVFGLNFKLTNVQAAIGLAQLDRLAERIEQQRRLRLWYADELAGLAPAIELVPVDLAGGEVTHWIDAIAADR